MKSTMTIINYFLDKLSYFLNLSEEEDEFKSYNIIKNFSEKELIGHDYKRSGFEIWKTLFNDNLGIDFNEVDKVYNIKRTYFNTYTVEKINYYIANKFWNLLDRYEIDTWNWTDEEVFLVPSLYVYCIFVKSQKQTLVIATLKDEKFTFMKKINVDNLSLSNFKHRQLAFSKPVGFYCI